MGPTIPAGCRSQSDEPGRWLSPTSAGQSLTQAPGSANNRLMSGNFPGGSNNWCPPRIYILWVRTVAELPQDKLPHESYPPAPPESELPKVVGESESDCVAARPIRLDTTRVESLLVQHAGELRRFLRGVLRNVDAAEDALQNTFAKAIEHGHTARDASLRAWLFRVAMNEAMVVRRRQQIDQKALERRATEQSSGTSQGSVENRASHESPESGLIHLETVRQVRDALLMLPEEQRRVVAMRMHEEKTFAAIAAELSVPLGTVLSRMQAALKKLKQTLDGK